MNNMSDLGWSFKGAHESDWRLMYSSLQNLSLDPLETLRQRALPPTEAKLCLLMLC